MNDKRFLELLNLYLDHEITPEDARSLEAEIRAHPERRRRYEQYCRMQSACVQLFEADRAQAPAHQAVARALAQANRQMAHPVSRERRLFWLAGGGFATLAAAACVAVVISKVTTPAATTARTEAATVVAAAPAGQPSPVATPVFDLGYAPKGNSVTAWTQKSFNLTETQTFAWSNNVSFRPVRKVDAQSALLNPKREGESKATSTLLNENVTEMTALQFKH